MPFTPKKENLLLFCFRTLLGSLLLVLRVPLLLITLPYILLVDSIFSQLGDSSLQNVLKRILVVPIVRVCLLLLGYVMIEEKVPDPRRIGLGKVPKDVLVGFRTALQGVKRGDVVVCNLTNFVQVLYLYCKLLPSFTQISLAAETQQPGEQVIFKAGLLATMLYASADYSLRSLRQTDLATLSEKDIIYREAMKDDLITVSSRVSSRVLILFPEVVRGNGTGMLRFAPAAQSLLSALARQETTGTQSRVHLLGFSYQYVRRSPHHTVGSRAGYVLSSLMSVTHHMVVQFVSHAVLNHHQLPLEQRKEIEADRLREILAKICGKKVKCVNLGVAEYFSFLDYYNTYQVKKMGASKKVD